MHYTQKNWNVNRLMRESAMNVTPSSLDVIRSPTVSSMMSGVKGKYFTRMAAIEGRSRNIGASDVFDLPVCIEIG